MARNTARPLSPHLTIWKWGPHMLVSILHRATGVTMATAGVTVLVWWLTAAASGAEAYADFHRMVVDAGADDGFARVTNILARLLGVGLTWALFQHMASGLRHLVLDAGAGYELKTNKTWAIATLIASATATALVWAYILTRN